MEDLATLAFEYMFRNATRHDVFPAKVLTLASKELRAAADQRRVWELAGDGWRTVLQSHKAVVLDELVSKLNTPKPEQVDALFDQLVGMTSLSASWKWKGTTADAARSKLANLVNLRGDIAHRVSTATSVKKAHVLDAAQFIDRLAAASSNAVRQFVHTRTRKYPWGEVEYSNPSSRRAPNRLADILAATQRRCVIQARVKNRIPATLGEHVVAAVIANETLSKQRSYHESTQTSAECRLSRV